MVFRHFSNMVGDIEEKRNDQDVNINTEVDSQNAFLANLACRVNKQNQVNLPFNPEEKADNLGRVAGFAVGVGSLYLQEALGYPFIVLRRQCQLNNGSFRNHILPFTLFRVVGKIHQRQGASVFWKGWGSSCIVKGSTIVAEVIISELFHIPRQSDTKSSESESSWQSVTARELLKGMSLMLTLPLYSASLVDTVQTNALESPRSVFAFLRDAFHRVIGSYTSRGHGRLLPIYSLILPSIVYGVLRYTIKSFITYIVFRLNKTRYNIDDQISEENMKKIYYSELMSNVLASFITDAVMFPFETVIVRLHLQGTRTIIDDTDKGVGVVPLCTNYAGVLDCVETIKRVEGVPGFFKGFGALLLQYVVQSCIVRLAKPMYCMKS